MFEQTKRILCIIVGKFLLNSWNTTDHHACDRNALQNYSSNDSTCWNFVTSHNSSSWQNSSAKKILLKHIIPVVQQQYNLRAIIYICFIKKVVQIWGLFWNYHDLYVCQVKSLRSSVVEWYTSEQLVFIVKKRTGINSFTYYMILSGSVQVSSKSDKKWRSYEGLKVFEAKAYK